MPPHNNPEKKPLLGGNGREASGDSNGSGALTARMAYESSNAEASRQYHEARGSAGGGSHGGSSDEDWHQSEGGLLKPVIFGGLDGILTSFAIVAGSAGGGLDPTVVLVLGFSNIFADALRYVDNNGWNCRN